MHLKGSVQFMDMNLNLSSSVERLFFVIVRDYELNVIGFVFIDVNANLNSLKRLNFCLYFVPWIQMMMNGRIIVCIVF